MECRKRPADGHVPSCPICGLTLRPGETDAHLNAELEKLERLFRVERISNDPRHGEKGLPSPSGRKGKDSPSLEAASRARFESYLQIRAKRQSRLHARTRNRKRRPEETVCPICNVRLTGLPEDLNAHVEHCLKRQRQGVGEEETVDVDGEVGEQYEDYRWPGSSRLSTALLPHGLPGGSGFPACKRSSEDEGDLNVDGDDSEEYGRPQFSESDLVPRSSDDAENNERQALRGAVIGEQVPRLAETATAGEPTPGSSESDGPLDLCQSESMTNGGQGTVAAALAARVHELSDSSQDKQKCLICLKAYQNPLVSIQCWHVHCEKCWFHTLGAKKLCPQCSVITSPADLRRIFL